MTRHLAVWLNADLVGVLSQAAAGRISFAYNDVWLDSPRAVPLSLSLPVRAESYDEAACRPFFAGLLPEAGARRAIASALHVSEQNDFALLDELGGECAGAVTLLPTDEALEPPANHYRPLSFDELAGLIRQLLRQPALATTAIPRFGTVVYIHRDELLADGALASRGEAVFRIEPLR